MARHFGRFKEGNGGKGKVVPLVNMPLEPSEQATVASELDPLS